MRTVCFSDESDRLTLASPVDLDEKLKALSRIFEVNALLFYASTSMSCSSLQLASEESGVDHPLCVDCASQVRMQMETEKRKIEAEISDYSEAVKRLESEEDGLYLLSDEEFEKKMREVSVHR